METTTNYAKLSGALIGGLNSMKFDFELSKAINYDENVLKLIREKIDKIIEIGQKVASEG